MSLDRLLIRNIPQLLEEVKHATAFIEDSVIIAMIDHPATTQELLHVRRLDVPASTKPQGHRDLSELLCEEVRAMPAPPHRHPTMTTLTTIIVRRGRNVWTDVESTWASAWRYSNHLTDSFAVDTIIVTEHGWSSTFCEVGGHEPRLEPAA